MLPARPGWRRDFRVSGCPGAAAFEEGCVARWRRAQGGLALSCPVRDASAAPGRVRRLGLPGWGPGRAGLRRRLSGRSFSSASDLSRLGDLSPRHPGEPQPALGRGARPAGLRPCTPPGARRRALPRRLRGAAAVRAWAACRGRAPEKAGRDLQGGEGRAWRPRRAGGVVRAEPQGGPRALEGRGEVIGGQAPADHGGATRRAAPWRSFRPLPRSRPPPSPYSSGFWRLAITLAWQRSRKVSGCYLACPESTRRLVCCL